MTNSRIAALTVTLGVALVGLAGVGPASASVVDRGPDVDQYNVDVDACGTPVNITGSITGHFVARLRGAQPLPYVTDHFVDSSTYTNLETGRSYTTVARITHSDVRITLVEGTIYEESIHEAGTFSVYDGDGALYYRQAGNRRITLVVDTMGTADDEDDQVLDFDYSTVGHFPGGDFCDDVQLTS